MLTLPLMLTSSARPSNGSRTCHPMHSKGLWPDSSQHRPRRTRHIGEEPAVSALPQMTHTAVAVEEKRKENGVKRNTGEDFDAEKCNERKREHSGLVVGSSAAQFGCKNATNSKKLNSGSKIQAMRFRLWISRMSNE